MKTSIFVFILILIFSVVTISCKKGTVKTAENLLDSISYQKNTPEWAKNAVIYEVNVRQYTSEGTFKAFQQHLTRLKSMGVDVLWLMPINPIGEKNRKGTLGSYYSVKDYSAVNPEYGTEQDLKNVVNAAHKLGMKVIIDWVANHTAWDNVWIEPHSDWYTKDSVGNIIIPKGTDWEDTADLNYENPNLRRAMIDAMSYWIKNTDIDGFRCDVAGMIPLNFWMHARKELDLLKPDLFFLAEDGEPVIHIAFDMTYDWQMKDIINDIAKGKKNVTDMVKHFDEEAIRFKPDDIRMHFVTNHDLNTWEGNEYERLKNDHAVDAFNVLDYTIPGMPLIYTGQEEPLKKRLRFFDKDTVVFKEYAKQDFIKKLNDLKKNNQALGSNDYKTSFRLLKNTNPTNILSFVRLSGKNQVLCIFNFSSQTQIFQLVDEIKGDFEKYMGAAISTASNSKITLKPWEYSVQISN